MAVGVWACVAALGGGRDGAQAGGETGNAGSVIRARVVARLGGDTADPREAFARVPSVDGIAVSAAGDLFILDGDAREVVVFGPGGQFKRVIGQAGQGPGDLRHPDAIEVAGGVVMVADRAGGAVTRWTLDGEVMSPVPRNDPAGLGQARQLFALADNEIVILMAGKVWDPEFGRMVAPDRRWELLHYRWNEGVWNAIWHVQRRIATSYHRAPVIDSTGKVVRGMNTAVSYMGTAVPKFARQDDHLCGFWQESYEVACLDRTGSVAWRFTRPEWKRAPVTRADIEREEEMWKQTLREEFADASFSWPEEHPALGSVAADGAGRLYVFPYHPAGAMDEPRPVDVFSGAGALIYSGQIVGIDQAWSAAWGPFVYGLERARSTNEVAVVKYELTAPF